MQTVLMIIFFACGDKEDTSSDENNLEPSGEDYSETAPEPAPR